MSKTACMLVVICAHLIVCPLVQSWNLLGRPGEGYYLKVLIGTPPQSFNVLVDTGSTNFAIAASENPYSDTYFVPSNSSTFRPLQKEVSLMYTQGNWKGHLGTDVVRIPNITVPVVNCDISLIESSNNFYMKGSFWQGILGLAYPMIAQPSHNMISWLEAVHIKNPSFSKTFSLELCGSGSDNDFHIGSFQLLDENRNFFSAFSSPIVREWFYEVSLVGIQVDNDTVDVPCQDFNNDKTIIDSGTTTLRLPNKVFQEVVQLMEAAAVGQDLSIPSDFWHQSRAYCGKVFTNLDNFPSIRLSIAHSETSYFVVHLSPQSYIRRVYDTSEKIGVKNCYEFAVESSDTGTVLGVVLMEGLVVVFNQTNKSVSFSESACGPPVKLSGPFQSDTDLRKCSILLDDDSLSTFVIAALATSSLLSICSIVLFYWKYMWLWKCCLSTKLKHSSSCENLVIE